MATPIGGYHQPATLEEVRTLWIGDLQFWVDENYLNSCFASTGEVVSVKVIRNKITGQPEGYGFVEFNSHIVAERILQNYNGTPMPGTEQLFRLNWASFGMGEKRLDNIPDFSIFVGDLAPDVTDYLLQETFRNIYPSVRGAKVVTDPNTGRSKGYGFVKFADEGERNRSMTEMNGIYCSTRPMRISAATPKKATSYQTPYVAPPKAVYPATSFASTSTVPPVPPDPDVTNTTIFVGNLDPNISEEELKQNFLLLGDIVYAKIPPGRGCGFIQFATRGAAEESTLRMQGHVIGQQQVRVSWGKKQDIAASWGVQGDQWNAYYGYDAYAYDAAQDPSLYAYGYAGYQYPHQVEGAQEFGGVMHHMEHREENFDPLAAPDVDRLNAAYISVHGSAILGRSVWMRTSPLAPV